MVIAGFSAWMAIGIASDGTREAFDLSYFGSTLIFFGIAFFISERPSRSFISRSQVLGVAAFFLWIGLNKLFYFGEHSLRHQFTSTALNLGLGISSIAVPYIFYWGAIFLIRRFYTDPAYQINEEAEQDAPSNR